MQGTDCGFFLKAAVRLEIDPTGTGWFGERAVAAPIVAKRRERDKNLAAVGDSPAPSLVSEVGRMDEQFSV